MNVKFHNVHGKTCLHCFEVCTCHYMKHCHDILNIGLTLCVAAIPAVCTSEAAPSSFLCPRPMGYARDNPAVLPAYRQPLLHRHVHPPHSPRRGLPSSTNSHDLHRPARGGGAAYRRPPATGAFRCASTATPACSQKAAPSLYFSPARCRRTVWPGRDRRCSWQRRQAVDCTSVFSTSVDCASVLVFCACWGL